MSDSSMILIRDRKNFSKLNPDVPIPNLVAIQTESFERFIQRNTPAEKRENIGLESALRNLFPVEDFNGGGCLEYVSYSVGYPKYDEMECLQRGISFSIALKVRVRLILWDREDPVDEKKVKDIKEQEIYLGEIPLMTDGGTFIINGTERVVVSQLHRSPGAFFSHDKGMTHSSGNVLYSARIIPSRGSWIDLEFDSKDIVYVRIDRRRKIPVTILMKAFGLGLEEIMREFYPLESVEYKAGKFWLQLDSNLHSGIKASYEVVDPASGDLLLKEGNKFTRAVLRRVMAAGISEVELKEENLVGKIVLNDLVDKNTGEVILEMLGVVTEEVIEKISSTSISKIEIAYMDMITVLPVIYDTLKQETVKSEDEAKVEIYKRLRPGETPTVDTARSFFESIFFNEKRYDLSEVGRLKINKRLGLDVDLSVRTLTRDDVVYTVKKLIQLKVSKGKSDDIDHLRNRRVRSVGELIEIQYRVGLARIERTIKERMNLIDLENAMPHDLINSKPVVAVLREFFGGSQLSQFMDQTNPLSEITHKRRLSALGPGGLTRERAGFEVRDVHTSHYGRICPIETPEGPNIGLVTSLATYAKVNRFGFIEVPCYKVKDSQRSNEVASLSAIDGDKYTIAHANVDLDADNRFVDNMVNVRSAGNFLMVEPAKIEYMDVSPMQVVSVATSLIPFLEHDDANRALMGSNMQRQAVPVLRSEAPYVGTGMEPIVARDSGYTLFSKRPGVVEQVDSTKVVVRADSEVFDPAEPVKLDIYNLIKYRRTNQSTCFNQRPIVKEGDRVLKGSPLVDGPSTDNAELALGKNALVAFMPWGGYNFEDAILVSERITKEDVFTSIHIEEFQIESRDTKLGREEIGREIPNVSEEALMNLDSSGVVCIGAEVKAGDILVGKVTPKGETQLTPEEKLLRAIFGEKAGDVKDTSLLVPTGVKGVVVDVKVFTRKGVEKDERVKAIEEAEYLKHEKAYDDAVAVISRERRVMLGKILVGEPLGELFELQSGDSLPAGTVIDDNLIKTISMHDVLNIPINNEDMKNEVVEIVKRINDQLESYCKKFDEKVEKLKKGTELSPGVIKLVKVYLAIKRKLSVGDKMAGRHGNKGVVSKVMPEEDMPFMEDGTPIDIVLNPLGVPSRMNVGQILEVHLALAAKALGLHVATPVFDGASEADIKALLKEANLPTSGQVRLIDGKTGEFMEAPVTVGYMYMMKLHHLVDDKIHARSVGPYSLVTQQPLGGKAQFGGQRLGEMEVWALEAYGAASILQEFLTVKSDDVQGRSKIYEAIIKGQNFLEPGLPESFNVLVKELQSLCLDVELETV